MQSCALNKVKDEVHFFSSCAQLQRERRAFYVQYIPDISCFMMMPDADKIRYLIQKDTIKDLGVLLGSLLAKRRCIMYKSN